MKNAFIILLPIYKAVDYDISHHATKADNLPWNKFYIFQKKVHFSKYIVYKTIVLLVFVRKTVRTLLYLLLFIHLEVFFYKILRFIKHTYVHTYFVN